MREWTRERYCKYMEERMCVLFLPFHLLDEDEINITFEIML